ncbi:hypothetical protein AB0L53_27225 [Nonomuraea sp. NPDC052129]|uniref:hypothetical protein n=1 Tax=Nonomuraea sp. NPDC052129 TaxID=3154651 RepID=UPI0034381450
MTYALVRQRWLDMNAYARATGLALGLLTDWRQPSATCHDDTKTTLRGLEWTRTG